MRDSRRLGMKAATRRTGTALVALVLAVALAPAARTDPPEFAPGAGLTAEDQARIGACTLVLGGFPTGGEAYGEAAVLTAAKALRRWELPEPVVIDRQEQAAVGAAALFQNGLVAGTQAPTELAYLLAGQDMRFWTFFDPDIVRPIPQEALDMVQDRTPIPKDPENRELDAYFDMIIYANRTAPAALDAAALKDEGLFAKVLHDPEKYRGQVLHFEGRLKKLRQFPAQAMAMQGGATEYYEGYLSVDAWQDDPVFFICTELPPGLKPAETLDIPASVSGYFYKVFRYKAADTKETHKDRLAPLVIGHTITLQGPAGPGTAQEEEGTAWPEWLGPAFFGVIALTMALLFLLGYWFRHGDHHVRGRLSAARYGEFIAPPPDDKSEAPGEPGASAPGYEAPAPRSTEPQPPAG